MKSPPKMIVAFITNQVAKDLKGGDLFLPILCSVMITGGGSTLTLGSPVRDAAAKGCGV